MQEHWPNSGLMFVETHVRLDPECSKQRFLKLARVLGYNALFMVNEQEGEEKVEVFPRVNVEGENLTEIKKRLRKAREEAIVAVPCLNREIATWAARNPDVDVIYFPSVELYRHVDASLVRLSLEGRTAIELSLAPLFNVEGVKRVKALSMLRRVATVLLKEGAIFFITREPRREEELRSPEGLIAIAGILGIPKEAALRALSLNPILIWEWKGYEGVQLVDMSKEKEDFFEGE